MEQPTLLDEPPHDAAIGAIHAWLGRTDRHLAMGVDEVGRGPLAGPVVAAAVILPPGPLDPRLTGLDDSKKLTEATREALFPHIHEVALAVGVGAVDAAEIDRINILEASRKAMHLAIAAIELEPRCLLVDGHLPLPGYRGEQFALIKGDGRSLHIAAASVVAKVTRDRQMIAWDADWPAYGFARHKGYGTPQHRRALTAHGPCPLHRRSFKWSPVP